jgi:TolB-like protein
VTYALYGFGRRIGVGIHVAKELLFMNTARILWAATLERARDENRKELPRNPNAFVDKGGR